MKPRRIALAAFALVAAAGAAWLALRAVESVPNQDTRAAAQQSEAPVSESLVSQPVPLDERHEVAHDDAIVAVPGGEFVRGLVLDVDGTPRGDVAIAQRVGPKQTLVARSGDDGRFTASIANYEGTLTTGEGAWVCVAPFNLRPLQAEQNLVLVVARAMALSGRVVDERGAGVAQATVGVRLTVDRAAALPKTLDQPSSMLASTLSDETGAFELARFACVPGARLQAMREPLTPSGEPLPLGDAPVLLVLRDPERAKLVHGFVVDTADRPLARVKVALGGNATETQDDGAFRIAVTERVWPLDPDAALEFELLGYQPREIEHFGRVVLDAPGPLPSQRVVLVAPDLRIRGVVLDAHGAPVPAGHVGVASEQHTGIIDGTLQGDGTFELRGLADRDYVLECELPRPRLRFRSEPIRAGSTDVVLRVPPDALVPRVVGRIVAPDGSVIPSAHVEVVLKRALDPRLQGLWVPYLRNPIECDSAGGFELLDVPRTDGVLAIEQPTIVSTTVDLGALDLTHELRIVVKRKSYLTLEATSGEGHYTVVSLLDDSGRAPRIEVKDGALTEGSAQLILHAGRSQTLTIAEGRYALTVGSSAGPALRRDIELVAGQLLVVQL